MQNHSSAGLLEWALSALGVVTAPIEAFRTPIKLPMLKLTHTYTVFTSQPCCSAGMLPKLCATYTNSKDPTWKNPARL